MAERSELKQTREIIRRALDEDIGDGDVTSLATIPVGAVQNGRFLAKAPGVVAGLAVAQQVFAAVDETIIVTPLVDDGATVEAGTAIATVSGPARAILTGERVALNVLQRMAGIATATRRYVDAVAGTGAVILDTRKTAPGLRVLDKWAVRLGGGSNHRFGLYDMVLIKDNHIAAVGSITEAVQRVRQNNPHNVPVEVEVKTLDELREALALPVDRIMLDNMRVDVMAKAVALRDGNRNGRIPLEASGGITLDTIRAVAETGVDYMSVGALTHSVRALDVSLDLGEE